MEFEPAEEIKEGNTEELLDLIRQTTTLNDFPIYERAEIGLKRFDAEEAFPIAKYVLEQRLAELTELEEKLQIHGLSIFDLDSVIEIGNVRMGPPVVEYSIDDAIPVIVDGLHRFYLAKESSLKINSLFIRNVHPDYPTISLPIEWDELSVVKEMPEIVEDRRKLREGIPNNDEVIRSFFRDFKFLGSPGRRLQSEQGG